MDLERIKDVVKKFSKFKVLVIGDLFLDKYYTYDPNIGRPSLETGLKPIVVVDYKPSPGAAGNVAKNFSLLGAQVKLIGIIGDDEEGITLRKCWADYGIDFSNVIISKSRPTQFYTKFFNKDTLREDLPRVDRHDMKKLTAEEKKLLIERIQKVIPTVDAVVIMDQYEMGNLRVLEAEIIEELRRMKSKFSEKVFFADSRLRIHEFADFCQLKLNTEELKILSENVLKGPDIEKLTEFLNYPELFAQKVARKIAVEFKNPLIITLGEKGSLVVSNDKFHKVPPKKTKVVDVCGAGDSYTAAMLLTLLSLENNLYQDVLHKAAEIGNLSAGICVGQVGTGKITPDILLENFEDISSIEFEDENLYINDLNLLKNLRKDGPNIKVALVDFDGTISLLRRGWENIMKEVMIEAITGGKEVSESLKFEIKKTVDNIIDSTTGVQTIVQMKVLVALVRKYGIVDEKMIKDEWYYKGIYNEKLKKMVNERINGIRSGELSKDDFLLSGAIEFLKSLRNRGLKIFLASGTDKSDVIDEAEFLGVIQLFDDMHGALKDHKAYSKSKLIEELTKKLGLKSGELLVVGDGPVEIKNGWKFGALTVGVASDEFNRRGWNLKKLSRLLNAKATIIIPDFECWKSVEKLIGNLNHEE